MKDRENKITKWFAMWLAGDCDGVEEIFCDDAVYTESWGPEYHGLKAIKHWFNEWNTRGKVVVWEITRFLHDDGFTLAEWRFSDEMRDGRRESFDGVSLVGWRGDKIASLKEYGCMSPSYDPYAEGDKPVFRGDGCPWL